MTRVVGLSGGIGTGKSTVARLLARAGAIVIDADAIVHRLQAAGSPLLDELATAFGPEVIGPEGALDRKRLADLVFRDPAARARLNAIVHPRVGAEMARALEAARQAGAALVVLDIPLLFEGRVTGRSGASALEFDDTVLVYAPRELQIERAVARDEGTREDIERRLAAQLPIEEKRALADHVIDNSGSLEETERQVRALFEVLVEG
jgi:dephospho-CoA kinase